MGATPAELTVFEQVRSCMMRALRLDEAAGARITERTSAADVPGWTSVAHLTLVLELEEAFGVTFENDEIVAMGSVPAIMQQLQNKGAGG